ncbi:MAG: MBL fold metallo-hydrolase [Clostridia bacterium]
MASQTSKKKSNSKSNKKTNLVFPKVKTLIFLIFCLALATGFFFSEIIEKFVNFSFFENNISASISDDGLKVHFIDVGQADAIAIEFPNGKHMLIDAGESKTTTQMNNYLTSTVFTNGEEKVFDYFLLTHSDADHSGGAKFVFENYVVNKIFRPKIYTEQEVTQQSLTNVAVHNTNTYKNFVSYANAEIDENGSSSEIVFSTVNIDFNEGGARVLFLGPIKDFYGATKYNEYSPIVLVEYEEKRILLTGDATIENELEIIDVLGEYCYDVDVLKVGHHGSSSSTSEEFLDAFKPEVAIISVGPKSEYGHPSDTILDRLNENGINDSNIYTTFVNGTIVVGVYRNEISEVVIGIVCGYTNEQPWISFWQIYVLTIVVAFGFMFSSEIKQYNTIYKKVKRKLSK